MKDLELGNVDEYKIGWTDHSNRVLGMMRLAKDKFHMNANYQVFIDEWISVLEKIHEPY